MRILATFVMVMMLAAANVASALPKISTFTDDFNRTGLDPMKWNLYSGVGFTSTVGSGVWTIQDSTTQSDGMFLTSVASYDATDSALLVNLQNPGNAATLAAVETWMLMYVTGGNGGQDTAKIRVIGGNLEAWHCIGVTCSTVASIAYNAPTMQWVRLRPSSGTLYYEYSGDGKAWTILFQESPYPFTMTSVVVEMGSWASGAIAGTVVFDNVNLPVQVQPPPTLCPDQGATPQTVNLEWGSAAGAASYKVYKSVDCGATFTFVTQVNGTPPTPWTQVQAMTQGLTLFRVTWLSGAVPPVESSQPLGGVYVNGQVQGSLGAGLN